MLGDPRHMTEDIRAADPLGADALLAAVPVLNARADTAALTVALRALVPAPSTPRSGASAARSRRCGTSASCSAP